MRFRIKNLQTVRESGKSRSVFWVERRYWYGWGTFTDNYEFGANSFDSIEEAQKAIARYVKKKRGDKIIESVLTIVEEKEY